MLRYRTLSKTQTRVSLVTIFEPSSDAEIGSDISAVGVSFDPSRKETLLEIYRVCNNSLRYPIAHGKRFPLPELEYVLEEINYLFKLILSLKPYETSQRSPDSSALSY